MIGYEWLKNMLSVGTTTHRDHKYSGKANKPVVFLLTVCIGLLKTEEEWWFISLGGEINLRCNRSRNEKSMQKWSLFSVLL